MAAPCEKNALNTDVQNKSQTQTSAQIPEPHGHVFCSENNKSQNSNAFQRFTNFVDDNIRLIRAGVTITAAIGVLLIARSIRVYHRFRRVSDIPQEFITKNMKLYGSVVEVKDDPVRIIVRHTPIVHVPKFWRWKVSDTNGGLSVHLAGVEPHEGCAEFLRGRLASCPTLRFHMLGVNHTNGLDCIVELTKWKIFIGRISLNEELLGLGLAKAAPLASLQDQALHTRLTHRLLAAEMQAERKSRGVWMLDRDPTKLDAAKARWRQLQQRLAPGLRAVGTIVLLPRRALRSLWGLLARGKKTGKDD